MGYHRAGNCLPLSSAERQRRRWASMTEEERQAYYAKRKLAPSRQAVYRFPKRVGEYKKKFGEGWLPVHERPFCGVDGEGGSWEGRHCYGMLTVGDQTLHNEDGSPLTSVQCLDFLTAQPKTRRYVIYFGGYDATLILRDLPVDVQQRIMDGVTGEDGKRTYVWWDNYGIDYIPRKLLKIVRKRTHPDGPGSITLYDTSAYFQCAFLRALKDWEVGTEEEWALIQAGKESRREFTLPAPPEVLTYNLLECRLLADLITKMVAAAEKLGITLRSYHGPATMAEALLDLHGVGEFIRPREEWPEEVQDWVRHAYFGGRFECSAVGIAPEVYEYDLASAYPAAMVDLPCQVCGEWQPDHVDGAQASLHWVEWDCSASTARFMPFPWRDQQGNLCYPRVGSGIYWGEEVAAAQRAFPGCVTVHSTWSYRTSCMHTPLAFMTEVYQQRKALGKETAGRVLKLAMNSAYGVFARTVGGGGRYSNGWWAGQITARTRARLLELAHLGGEAVLMLATDGLYASRPLSVSTGHSLGDWEDGGQVGPLLLVQPGVYFSLAADGKKWRTRGVSLRDVQATDGIRRLQEAWLMDGPDAVVPMNVNFLLAGSDEPNIFVGTKLALSWGKPELIGTWRPLDKSLSFRPEPRRLRGEWEGYLLRTMPPTHQIAALGVLSAPYKKMQGRNEEVEAVAYDQPELPW